MNEEERNAEAVNGFLNGASDWMKQVSPAAGGAAVGALRDKASDERRQRFYKENQALLFSYGQKAQRNAALNMVQGLRQAGLSPALAAGAPSGMSVSAASMPSGSTGTPAPTPQSALVASEKLTQEAERDVLRSQAELNDAKTTGVMIDNDNKEGESYIFRRAFDSVLDAHESAAKAKGDEVSLAVIASMRNAGDLMQNAGSFRAMRDAIASTADYPETLNKRVKEMGNALVYEQQLKNDVVVSSLITSPYWENAKIRSEIVELGALALKFTSDAKVNEHLLPSIDMKVQEIQRSMEHLDVEDRISKHNDLAGLIKDRDGVGAASYIIEGAVKIAASIAGIYIGAKTHAKSMPTPKTDVNVEIPASKSSKTAVPSKPAPSLEDMTNKINRQRAQRRSRRENNDHWRGRSR